MLAIPAFGLRRWTRLPAARTRCVGHFLGIAATLAAAKVLLSTIGVTLFVAENGAAGLAPFYVVFAAVAILVSFGLSAIIDRAAKVRFAQLVFVTARYDDIGAGFGQPARHRFTKAFAAAGDQCDAAGEIK